MFRFKCGDVAAKAKAHHFSIVHLRKAPRSDTRFLVSYNNGGRVVFVNLPERLLSLNVRVYNTIVVILLL